MRAIEISHNVVRNSIKFLIISHNLLVLINFQVPLLFTRLLYEDRDLVYMVSGRLPACLL